MDTMEITKAIGAHGKWKERLRQAIQDGQREYKPEAVEVDNLRDFGKWFYALPAADQKSPQWKPVQKLHADFHKETSRILKLIYAGKTAEAVKSMEAGSEYTKISSQLTSTMIAWRESLK